MQYKNAAIVVAGLMAQQAVSFGGSWNDQNPYSCPENTNNQCSSSQQGGYDWSGLSSGSFGSYGSNQFSGFSCSNSFGKRDVLSKRAFQSKCISANLGDNPSMSCDEGSNFSINEMQVSASQDVDIQCEYGMPDGTTCTEYHSCSSEGSVIQNSQCGGAKSVTFKPGANAPPSCSIGVHSIGFHCGPPSSTAAYTPPASSSVPPVSYSNTPSSAAPSSTPGCYGSSCSSSSSPPSSSSPVSSSPPCYGSDCSSSAAPPSSSSPGCYGSECSSSSSPVSSSSPPCYGASCSSSSVAPVSSYPAPSSSAPAVTSYPAPSSSSAAPTSPPSPSCPDLLPRCLKTFLYMTTCTDASDYSCFCGDEAYITKVFGCVSAWGTESDTQAAASYLMGICAPYIPNNPAIITACPSTVTPTASATETDRCTTVTYSSSVVVPATYSTGLSAGYSIPASSYTTQLITTVTIPQVQFTTSTITVAGTTTCSVGLGTGAPSSVPAYTTPPAATSSGALVCGEFTDGQPQCSTASAPVASTPPAYTTAPASSAPAASAPPSYGSSAAAASTSFGTSWAPYPSATYSSIVPSTGDGTKIGSGLAGLALGAIAALAAL